MHFIDRLRARARRYKTDIIGVRGTVSGSYSIKGQSIIGRVNGTPFVTNHGTKVQALRGPAMIAETEVVATRSGERMPFAMSMASIFTIEELIRERVVITAVNARGDKGLLVLDGATRLELIREYLGEPSDKILDLDFTQDGNAGAALRQGWSRPEDNFTWTEGDDSFIELPALQAPADYTIRLVAGAYITDFVSRQVMEVFYENLSVGSFAADMPDLQFREFRFASGGSARAFGGAARLRLHHPNAARPSDHTGSRDARRLAFRLKKLILIQLLRT